MRRERSGPEGIIYVLQRFKLGLDVVVEARDIGKRTKKNEICLIDLTVELVVHSVKCAQVDLTLLHATYIYKHISIFLQRRLEYLTRRSTPVTRAIISIRNNY